ncbi:MAG: lipopolysaccharide transport system ATP-binding protein [Candidatus Nitrotoga sp. CP45]|nr:MAG: lipopolysaccharide transport system ATP-binding protein [Candidatus Nitrotoga sp. CP45]
MSFNDIAIRVSNLSKCYHIYDTPRDRLKQFILPRLYRVAGQPPKQYFREFWALKDVSFEIKKGESVGIVGRNGSGKSTFLQIITGTLSPTTGTVAIHGRIAALLELGSGFNPEFTGRENVFLNAAILGLSKEEVAERFDDIADFANIGPFIEQPVKTYSSGMLVRLAFAVAINVDPDILIIDEALSVGDELFQRKCFSRIETIRASGATILFVSHSSSAIVELCDRAVLMDAGEKLAVGEPKQIVGCYQKLLYAPVDKCEYIREQIRRADELPVNIPGLAENDPQEHPNASAHFETLQESFDPNLSPSSTIEYESSGAYIESPAVLTLEGEQVNNLIQGKNYFFTYTVQFSKFANHVLFGMLIKTVSGVELGGGRSAKSRQHRLVCAKKGECYRVKFRFRCALNPGVYFLNAGVSGVVGDVDGYLHRILDSVCIRVIGNSDGFSNGNVDFDILPEISK